MVKPAMTYLDVVSDLRRELDVPLCAYHVSGEYAMIKAAGANGWIDASAVAIEQLTAIRRAGADFILTYLAGEVAGSLDVERIKSSVVRSCPTRDPWWCRLARSFFSFRRRHSVHRAKWEGCLRHRR